jgi:diguanylate cyclase (GGDEF)-like protein/PAS domain S-box-containing protein
MMGDPVHEERGLRVNMKRNTAGVITAVDDSVTEMLGWLPEEWIGSPSTRFLHPEDQPSAIAAWIDMIMSPGLTRVWRGRYQTAAGEWAWVETVNTLDETGTPVVISSMSRVTGEQAGVEEELRAREQLLSRLSDALPVGVFQINVKRQITFANNQLHDIVGGEPAATIDAQLVAVTADDFSVVQTAIDRALANEPVDDLEVRLQPVSSAADDRVCVISLRTLTDADGNVTGAVGCISDVTDRAHLRRELELRASIDELTSCLNRSATLEVVRRLVSIEGERPLGCAVVYVDLDRFKAVNDQYGHAVGDQLLIESTRRIRSVIRDGDHVGRLGGDEFLVICPRVDTAELAVAIAERVASTTRATVAIDGHQVELCASVGLAWTSVPIDADTFIAQADSAMYESKRQRRGGVTLFTAHGPAADPD